VNNPPGERYLDIIMRGCVHYGVKQEWIDYLKTHPCTPRKKVSEFQKIPLPTDPAILAKIFTMEGTEPLRSLNTPQTKFRG
jgi:hypothetical protein